MIIAPIELVAVLGILGILIEIFASVISSMSIRKALYVLVVVICCFSVSVLLMNSFSILSVGVIIVALFRVFNAFRVVYGRQNPQRLLQSTKRTSMYFILYQMLTFVLFYLALHYPIIQENFWLAVSAISAFCISWLVYSTKFNLAKSTLRPSDKYFSDMELPSVSVCIPARNETEQLSACLSSIIKSEYQKLEVLVLDDCSQDKTSEIIKGFAHDGVRFIPGQEPKKGWLAKNQAYQDLSEAASGEILIFCGVDVRLEKYAIRSTIVSMIARKKMMISVLPRGLQSVANARLLQPMRYWWELSMPRRKFNRPPVLSTYWAISKQSFIELGEMKSVRGSVMPEVYFARELAKSDEYSFMRSNGKLTLFSAKTLPDQWQTSIRTRYPRLKNRPENVLVVCLLELSMIFLPFLVLPIAIISGQYLLIIIAIFNILMLLIIHLLIVLAWGVKNPIMAVALLPVAVFFEIYATLVSMWRYEFGRVEWKDRNICLPALNHYPKLPSA